MQEEYQRIKDGVKISAQLSVVIALAVGAVLLMVFGHEILGIFISPTETHRQKKF